MSTGNVFPRHLLMANGTARCGETHPTHTTRVPRQVQCPRCIAQFTPTEARHALDAELINAFDTLAAAQRATPAPTLADDVAALRAILARQAPGMHRDGILARLDRIAGAVPQRATDDEGWPLYRSPCGDVRGWYGDRPTDDRLYCQLCNDSHAMSTEWQALYTLGGA